MRHGVFKGTVLAVARVLRCSGLFRGGEDPVPERVSWRNIREQYRRFNRRGGNEQNDRNTRSGNGGSNHLES